MQQDTLLIQMTQQKSLEGVNELIEAGVDLNAQNDKGQTAVMLATQNGSAEIAIALINAGADLNKQDKFGLTGLMYTCKLGNKALAKLWIDGGADLSIQDKNGYTALRIAQMYHQDAIIEMLQAAQTTHAAAQPEQPAQEPAAPEVQLTMKEKLFIAACANGENQTALKFLEGGISPNLKVSDVSLLWIALVNNNEELTKALIKAGANVNEQYEGKYPLMIAIESGNTEIVELMLSAKADIHRTDANGNTAVMYAFMLQAWPMASVLIKAGADVNTHVNDISLLWYALLKGPQELVLQLIQAGANIQEQYQSLTPLSLAISEGKTEIVKALVEAKADLQSPDGKGYIPLVYAVAKQHWHLVQYLVSVGANPNIQLQGNSLLIVCLAHNQPQVALEVIKAGADVNKANADGVTPLYLAQQSNYTEVVAALQAAGATR